METLIAASQLRNDGNLPIGRFRCVDLQKSCGEVLACLAFHAFSGNLFSFLFLVLLSAPELVVLLQWFLSLWGGFCSLVVDCPLSEVSSAGLTKYFLKTQKLRILQPCP